VVVGLSSGSGIAVDAALADPERIAGLVLAAPTVGGYRPTGSFAWMAPVVEAAQAGDEVTAAERFADTELMQVHARVAVAVRDMIVDNAGLWSLRQNPAVPLEPPAIERLDGIAIPVLVVVGGADTEDTKAVAAVLSQGIRDVRVEELPGAGHLVNFTAPDRFDRLLERFLAEVWP
jgi:pimeloyl-ACP methyl ester carboxylesterase